MALVTRSFSTVVLLACVALSCFAQDTFWGVNSAGGSKSVGVIYAMTRAGAYTKHYDMERIDGARPTGQMVRWTDGLLYGVATLGGDNGAGLIFSYDPTNGEYLVRASFTAGTIGSGPRGGLTLASNGRMYGVCSTGGANGMGTIFQFDPATNSLLVRVAFAGTANGREPSGTLVEGAGGVLWGTTFQGGANGTGTVFTYQPGATTVTRRYSFDALTGNVSGRAPRTGLTTTANGRMFGIAQAGGAGNGGTIYEIRTTSPYTVTVVKAMDATFGNRATSGGLVRGADGNKLYGTTTAGGTLSGGSFFEVNASTTTAVATKLRDIDANSLRNIAVEMTLGADGSLYGVSSAGGQDGAGSLFRYVPTTNTLSVLGGLASIDGKESYVRLLVHNGELYGATFLGGPSNGGHIFRYANGQLYGLVTFGLTAGSYPRGRLLAATNGRYYGTTLNGGQHGFGVVFSYEPTSGRYTRVRDLQAVDGKYPEGGLTEVNGKLYGLAAYGGANDAGTVFSIDLATHAFTKLADLSSALGSRPLGHFLYASNGSLYTITSTGGANNVGSVLRLVPATGAVTKVRDMVAATTGGASYGRLIQLPGGNIIGTSSSGGAGAVGTLFAMDPSTHVLTVLHAFSGVDGGAPIGGLVRAANGMLYGLTSEGGGYNYGGIYRFDPATSNFEHINDLTAAMGKYPVSELVQGADGRLYGSCKEGGTSENGTLFVFTPSTGSLTNLLALTSATGYHPFAGMVAANTAQPTAEVRLAVKVLLDGPFVPAAGLMRDDLRALSSFPRTEPYTGLGYAHVGGGGGEQVAASVLTNSGSNAIVDWVVVELRQAGQPGTVLRTRSALLQRDGDVVDVDGTSPVRFDVQSGTSYHVAVRHRNHLGMMTNGTVTLSSSATVLVDLSAAGTATYGTDAGRLHGALRTAWAGNTRNDRTILYLGQNNDRDPMLARIGGEIPTAEVTGYWVEDVNLDGKVLYIGTNNDRDVLLGTIGGELPTASRTEQLP